jgi:hypothetical protein
MQGVLHVLRVLQVLLLVGGVAIVALALVELLARVGERRVTVVVALTLALLATAPRLLGTPFESLALGMLSLTMLCAYPAYRGARRMLLAPVVHERADVAFIAVFSLVVFLGAWIELGARLWDGDFGHFGFSSGIARGVLPPEHPLFPGEPLRYHVGFDVLVALVVLAGVPVGAAVHVVSVALLALLLFVARDVGRALGVNGAWPAAFVLLGYAPTSMCIAASWGAANVCGAWFPPTWVSAQMMPPTVFSSFFQHPQGLAMPIALACMLLALPSRAEPARGEPSLGRTLVCGVALVALAQCQIAYFACAGLGIGVALLLHGVRRAWLALPLLAAAAIALFTSDIAGGASELQFGLGYFGRDAHPLRYLAIFGLTLLAPVAALVLYGRASGAPGVPGAPGAPLVRALAVASLSGFVVASVFTYARSWDIVKFFAIGAFFGNVLLALLLARLVSARLVSARLVSARLVSARLLVRPLSVRAGLSVRSLAVTLAILSLSSATFWAVRSGVLNGVIAPYYGLPPASPLGEALLRVAGDDIAPRDTILTARFDIWHQGFHVVGADHRTLAKGQLIDRARAEDRARAARRALKTLDDASLDALSVDWLLLPASRGGSLDGTRFVHHARVLDHDLYRVVRK